MFLSLFMFPKKFFSELKKKKVVENANDKWVGIREKNSILN